MQRFHRGDERLQQLVVDLRPGDDPRSSRAVLAGVPVTRDLDPLGDCGGIRVVEHEHRRLSAELEVHALQIVRRRARDQLPGLDVTGQRHHAHVRVLHDRLARGHAVTGDDVEHAGREDLRRQLSKPQRRQRRLLGRLEHLHVARGQRGGELPHGHHQRVVPGSDAPDDPDRLAAEEGRVAAHVLAGGLALEHARRSREEPDVVRANRHLVLRVRQRLADVPRLDLRELVRVLVERVGELQQHLGALTGRRLQPLGQRLLRGLDGAVDVLCRCARHLGDRVAGRRVEHLHGLAAGGVDPLAADEVLVT